MTDPRDFTTCAWAGRAKKLTDAWFCNIKRLQLEPHDLGCGICPCEKWVNKEKFKVKNDVLVEKEQKGLF